MGECTVGIKQEGPQYEALGNSTYFFNHIQCKVIIRDLLQILAF